MTLLASPMSSQTHCRCTTMLGAQPQPGHRVSTPFPCGCKPEHSLRNMAPSTSWPLKLLIWLDGSTAQRQME